MAELLPCPFCGHPAILVCHNSKHGKYYFSVQCSNLQDEGFDMCPVIPQTYEHSEKERAIEAWNKRSKEYKK